MFKQLFIPRTKQAHVEIPVDWWTLERVIQDNVDRAMNYYRYHQQFINSQHVLVQYLTALRGNVHLDDLSYYHYLKDRAVSLSTVFNFTSSYSTGKVFEGVFARGDNEVIVVYPGQYPLGFIDEHWRDVRACRYLRHDYLGLDYTLPKGQQKSLWGNVSVVLIDVVLLGLQYRAFVLAEEAKASLGSQPRGVTDFVSMYVLPGMIPSQIDCGIVNQYRASLADTVSEPLSRRVMFNVMDVDTRLENSVNRTVKVLRGNSRGLSDNLASIKLMSVEDAGEFMVNPEMLINRQCAWAFLLARLPLLSLGISLGGESGMKRNRQWLPRMKRELAYLKHDAVVWQANLRGVSRVLQNEIDAFLALTA